jgi:putative colanic acid biosynthesis acetyltransferase WcaF
MREVASTAGQAAGRFYPRPYANRLSLGNRVARVAWQVVCGLLFRSSPTPCFWWRRRVLELFGARMELGTKVYPSTRIWAPWNLRMSDGSCLGPSVNCYNVASVEVGIQATVSEGSFLCTASHAIHEPDFALTGAPIRIGDGAVIFAEAFIGPGVTVAEGAVVGARAVVFRDVAAYRIVAGNPGRDIGQRRYRPTDFSDSVQTSQSMP